MRLTGPGLTGPGLTGPGLTGPGLIGSGEAGFLGRRAPGAFAFRCLRSIGIGRAPCCGRRERTAAGCTRLAF